MRSQREQVKDEWLVLRWQDGEVDAMNELVERWNARLLRHARRLTDSDQGAADIVQEAWLGIVRTIGRLNDPARFSYWAYRIVSNKAADRIRRRSRRRASNLDDETGIVDLRNSANDSVDAKDEVTSLLKGLSVQHRTVVSLRYGEDLSVKRIAQVLRLPVGTVKSRLHYALESMRRSRDIPTSPPRKDGAR